ncbi:MAG: hypothetical protein Q9163_005323 [Psora crenata]
MDFASLMSTEISKSKSPPRTSESTKKYLKKAELEAQRQETYLQDQASLRREREEKLQQKRKRDEEESLKKQERDEKRRRLAEESRLRREELEAREERARRKRLGLPEVPAKEGDAKSSQDTSISQGEEDISEEELRPKLRDLNEPVTLFGETHTSRLQRYRNLTATGTGSALTRSLGSKDPKDPVPTTLDPVPGAEMRVPATTPSDPAAKKYVYRQLASYFNMLLSEWRIALAQRDASVKASSQGKQAEAAMQQSLGNMRPLFHQFETASLSDAILGPLLEIVSAAQERRYVDANNGYLRLSIGKAAWPIGVTMVGIHERSAREKLHESDKGGAHIMSDEATRKFLQSIKRCLSFAQVRWPPEDLAQLMG